MACSGEVYSPVYDLSDWHAGDEEKRADIIHAIIENRQTKHLQDILQTGWDVNETLAVSIPDNLDAVVTPHDRLPVTTCRCSRTALQVAVGEPAWTEGVRLLLHAGANPNLCPGSLDPLTLAVSQGRIDDQIAAVKLLLAHGADLNGTNQPVEEPGVSPLIYAIRSSSEDDFDTRVVDLLLENGADPNLIKSDLMPRGYCTKVPLYLALQGLQIAFSNLRHKPHRHLDDIQTVMRHEKENAKKANAALFESLVRFGADVNWNISVVNLDVRVVEQYCRSLLHRLVLPFQPQEQYEFLPQHLDLLFKGRCDIERRDVHNRSALESAVRGCGNSNTVRWLIRHGADTTGLQFNHLHALLIPRKVRSWHIHGHISQYAARPVWNETPLILLKAGMRVSNTLHLHLIVIQQAIQAFLADEDPDDAAEAALYTEIRDLWDQIKEEDARDRSKSRKGNASTYSYQRTHQVVDLGKFSDEALYVYPEEKYTRDPHDQWQYTLTLVNQTLDFLSQTHSLLWWCRRSIRNNLESLAPSAMKTIQVPAIMKRYILCHEL